MLKKIALDIVRNKAVSWVTIRLLRLGFWRKLRIRKYLNIAIEPKLQIGSGRNPLKGWLNTGISLRESWSGVYMDAGKAFPLPDSSFEFVFSEHLFEHLSYLQGINMLKECYRVLKPGGTIRIATPDLRFLIGLYQNPEEPIHKEYIEYSAKKGGLPTTSVFVINRFHTAWGHQIIYDKETLTKLLIDTGFKNVVSCEVGKSQHKVLNGVEGHFKLLPYEFNLLETMILEATK
jgi:predicted SAM-dependent methyltransferase